MLVLAIDTASVFCAAGIVEDGRPLAKVRENIGKGHAERLMGQIAAVMKEAGKNFTDIDRIGVNTGPGSFTGVRVAIAAARGLALALAKPAIGVNAFEALAFEAAGHGRHQSVTVVLEAGRGAFYVQDFDADNRKIHDPAIDTADAIAAKLPAGALLTGSGAAEIARLAQCTPASTAPTADIETYAALAAVKEPGQSPVPLYMRPPDAKPQTGFALPRACIAPAFQPKKNPVNWKLRN